MIKKTITYENLDGEMVTEDFYFHMRQVDLAKMNSRYEGGLQAALEKAMQGKDLGQMMILIEDVIGTSFGTRINANQFDPDPEKARIFLASPAFDALITDLGQGNNAVQFLLGTLPKSLAANPDLIKAMEEAEPAAAETAVLPAAPERLPWADRKPTPLELRTMTREQLMDVYARDHSSQE